MNKDDFYKATKADWKFKRNVSLKYRNQFIAEADFVSDSFSAYKYTSRGVYRLSNHFNHNVASCDWTLDGQEHNCGFVLAYCSWKNFERKLSTIYGVTGYWYNYNFYTEDGKEFDILAVAR
jgi:hypothetical protein